MRDKTWTKGEASRYFIEGRSQAFPVLTATAIDRIMRYGVSGEVSEGTVLVRQGQPMDQFIVVESGAIEVDQTSGFGTELIATHGPGEFFGDVHLLSGRQSVVRARMTKAGRVLKIQRSELQTLMQNDSALGEVLLRAFILRRLELLATAKGDAILLGSSNSVGTLRIREFLTRNGYLTRSSSDTPPILISSPRTRCSSVDSSTACTKRNRTTLDYLNRCCYF